jgi:hypothetical protein
LVHHSGGLGGVCRIGKIFGARIFEYARILAGFLHSFLSYGTAPWLIGLIAPRIGGLLQDGSLKGSG